MDLGFLSSSSTAALLGVCRVVLYGVSLPSAAPQLAAVDYSGLRGVVWSIFPVEDLAI
jgi:hypothetical protein